MLGRRKRNRYKFTEKKQSKKGIAALVVAILIEIIYIVFLNTAIRTNGGLSMYFLRSASTSVFIAMPSYEGIIP